MLFGIPADTVMLGQGLLQGHEPVEIGQTWSLILKQLGPQGSEAQRLF
jgi:hypothetical protein